MKKRITVNLVKYGGCASFVALIVWFYMSQRDFAGAALVDQYKMLCDAFTIPGVVLIMIGALCWVASQGAMDGLIYCVRFAVFSLIPGRRAERDERYADYVMRVRGKRAKGYGFLFFSGMATMVIAFVFMFLFYSIYTK